MNKILMNKKMIKITMNKEHNYNTSDKNQLVGILL